MSSQGDLAIVLVAYGSLSAQARTTYDKIKVTYEWEFPDAKVEIAFTAGFIRRRLEKEGEEGVFFHNPLTALARLQDSGCKDVVVQSLHVVPGSEFHQVASLVRGLRSVGGKFGFQNLVMGMPLLASREDYLKASSALKPHLERICVDEEIFARPRDPGELAVVLVGHGTDHPADSAYARMAWTLRGDHENVFLGTLDGFPGIDEVLEQVRSAGAKSVRLMPFLLVAGGHALKDLAGDGPGSWKSAFEREGFETEVCLQGLGDSPEIVQIFLEHTREALGETHCRISHPK